MNQQRRSRVISLLALCLLLCVAAGVRADDIAAGSITALETKLVEAGESSSSARQKLALRRVVREGEALIEQHPDAPNRYAVLGVLFRAQQELVKLDGSAETRQAFLAVCRQLAEAPDAFADIRLDADLLLSQAGLARQGAGLQERADALRDLVARYRDTTVEAKVIRVAMLMALEFGDAALVGDLQQVIAERFPGDLDMIIFQREKLAGQVFGAPFIGVFERADGGTMRFPMDTLGVTTAVLFWSKDNGGQEHLKELGAVWKEKKQEAEGRLQLISINLDDLPDAGRSILDEHGLDWPALRLPGGRESPIYQAYAMRDPAIITVSPTGYAALFMAGGNSDTNGYERWMQSSLARQWTRTDCTAQLQSLLAGEWLVIDPTGPFDPAAPPEWQAARFGTTDASAKLKRTAQSVPEDQLRAIQACFIAPPRRYDVSFDDVKARYEIAEQLCAKAIADYPDAPDLWVVRNRRIVALMGLWKLSSDNALLGRAAEEARAALDAGYPEGTDVVARLCLARQALHETGADARSESESISSLIDSKNSSGTQLFAGALLAMELGDRPLHERLRRSFLDEHVDNPMLWTATAFLLDRYHRYWLYHPPFTAGWTYGRRQGHFLAIGTPEDARRSLALQLKSVDGQTVRVPEDAQGKWTVINFVPNAQANIHLSRYGTFVTERPFTDVSLVAAVLDDDTEALKAALALKKKPDPFPTLLVPGGMDNPIVQQLGLLDLDDKPNLVVVRPDGSIAAVLSGLSMSSQHGNVIQNVIEWHDEQAVDQAIARGDLDEAKRLAFAFAPVEQPTPPGQKPKPAKAISNPHLRARAKVYMAMGEWASAFADAEAAYLEINSKAGWLSMRTAELDEIERLKAEIEKRLARPDSTP